MASNASVHAMRVLVTRPKNQAEHFVKLLELMGYQTQCMPLLEIVPIDLSEDQIRRYVEGIRSADKLIAVSANSATYGLPLLNTVSGASQSDTVLPDIYAIGPSTASVLEEKGYTVDIPKSNFNSESLLELEPFSEIKGQKVAILCGHGGRDYLEKELASRGAEVTRIELYARTPAALEVLGFESLKQPDVLTAMSGDTVTALFLALNASDHESWCNLPLIVPGSRVEAIAREIGFTNIYATEKPNTESLLDTLGKLA